MISLVQTGLVPVCDQITNMKEDPTEPKDQKLDFNTFPGFANGETLLTSPISNLENIS